MFAILHGYLLEGSGSNLWTRAMLRALCQRGETVHLLCQDPTPEHYHFVASAYLHHPNGDMEKQFSKEIPFPGRVILHRPILNDLLPVFVRDHYPHFSRVEPMVDLDDTEIEDYLSRNLAALKNIHQKWHLKALHANHLVLTCVVAQRFYQYSGVPYTAMPHGSDIEYGTKKDPRLHKMARDVLNQAGSVIVSGDEIKTRIIEQFPELPTIDKKITILPLGVNTQQFQQIPKDQRAQQIDQLLIQAQELPRRQKSSPLNRLFHNQEPNQEKWIKEATPRLTNSNSKRPDLDLEDKLKIIDWQNDPIALFVGRLIAAKGLLSILAALPDVFSRHPNLKLIIVGHGPLRDMAEHFIQALKQGDERWLKALIQWGSVLENPVAHVKPVAHFFSALQKENQWDNYLQTAQQHLSPQQVIFTGYLTHRELCHLFACADVALFPSMVAESGPLVFLEALASGCFPLGTDFAGMKASIDALSQTIPKTSCDQMRLNPTPQHTIEEIRQKLPQALEQTTSHAEALRAFILKNHDWQSVAKQLTNILNQLNK
ncbi:glycosyltransferase [Magnetococcales bacterium HHB-1]